MDLWILGVRGRIRARKILSFLKERETTTLPEIYEALLIHPRYHSAFRKLLDRMVELRVLHRWSAHQGVAYVYAHLHRYPDILILQDEESCHSDVLYFYEGASCLAVLADRGFRARKRWAVLEPERLFGENYGTISEALDTIRR